MNPDPNQTPEKISEIYFGIPALRVHNRDWRPEFGGIIPGVVNVVKGSAAIENRIRFLRNKFCCHQIKVLSNHGSLDTLVFRGEFPVQPLKELAQKWQKTALKTFVSHGGVGHAPYVDATIYRTPGEIHFYAISPEEGDIDLWKKSCQQIALVLDAQNSEFEGLNLQKID